MIAVGPGAPDKDGKIVPTSVKSGDRVLLPGWGGNSIKVGEDVSTVFCRLSFLAWLPCYSYSVYHSCYTYIFFFLLLFSLLKLITDDACLEQEFHIFRDSEILAKINE